MQIRRCATVFLEPRERLDFDLKRLIEGTGTGLDSVLEWVALTPHLDDELVLSLEELAVLGDVSPNNWIESSTLTASHREQVVQHLLETGLLIAEATPESDTNRADQEVRAGHWRGISATLHRHTRWHAIDTLEEERKFGQHAEQTFLERLGPPEPPVRERVEASKRIALQPAKRTPLEDLIRQRVTCRNWDATRALSMQDLADTLYRTFAARAVSDEPGITVMKRAVPSAGGLHPTEAYLLVQNVEGVQPGLYHYHPIDHALEPLGEVAADASAALALRLVAGQRHFMNAHVVIVLASRFRRTFWKYRNHAKAYRAVILDAGHLSQTLYLAATERGLAAFITAAVNERDIEEVFGLDPMLEGVLAVCGFGWRGEMIEELEFDPLGSVWPKAAS